MPLIAEWLALGRQWPSNVNWSEPSEAGPTSPLSAAAWSTLATRAWLFLNHLDGFLVEQSTLVNKRSRAVIPALVQRQALADHLVRLLEKLGLDQAPKKVVDLTSYVAERYGAAERVRYSGSDTSAQPAPPTTSTTPAATETRAGPAPGVRRRRAAETSRARPSRRTA